MTAARKKGAKRGVPNHQPAVNELGITRPPKLRSSWATAPKGT